MGSQFALDTLQKFLAELAEDSVGGVLLEHAIQLVKQNQFLQQLSVQDHKHLDFHLK